LNTVASPNDGFSNSLSAEVVTTWYQLAEAQSQLDLIEEQIETNTDVLELLENRFGAGHPSVFSQILSPSFPCCLFPVPRASTGGPYPPS
jgi:hypothetical protein